MKEDRVGPLDGIRIVALLTVLVTHVALFASWVFPEHEVEALLAGEPSLFSSAFWGVDVFFVLSGFLLWRTLRRCGSMVGLLRHRFFRLWWTYLVAALVMSSGGSNPKCGLSFELGFLQNLLVHPSKFCMAHGWSTHVDWQAWLLCVGVFALCRQNEQAFARVLMGLVVVALFINVGWYWQLGFPRLPSFLTMPDILESGEEFESMRLLFGEPAFSYRAEKTAKALLWEGYNPMYFFASNRYSALLIGVLVAMAYYRNVRSQWLTEVGLVGLGACVMNVPSPLSPSWWLISYRFWFCAFLGVSLLGLLLSQDLLSRTLRKLLQWQGFAFLSEYCYEIYLLHPAVSAFIWKVPPHYLEISLFPVFVKVLTVLVLTLAVSVPIVQVQKWARRLVSDGQKTT